MYIRKLYPYILLACSFCFPLQASSSEKIEKAYFSTNTGRLSLPLYQIEKRNGRLKIWRMKTKRALHSDFVFYVRRLCDIHEIRAPYTIYQPLDTTTEISIKESILKDDLQIFHIRKKIEVFQMEAGELDYPFSYENCVFVGKKTIGDNTTFVELQDQDPFILEQKEEGDLVCVGIIFRNQNGKDFVVGKKKVGYDEHILQYESSETYTTEVPILSKERPIITIDLGLENITEETLSEDDTESDSSNMPDLIDIEEEASVILLQRTNQDESQSERERGLQYLEEKPTKKISTSTKISAFACTSALILSVAGVVGCYYNTTLSKKKKSREKR